MRVGVGVAERAGVAVLGRVDVRVAVGTAVDVGVAVGGRPICTIISVRAPTSPARSRTCTATVVRPSGKAILPSIDRQYWTTGPPLVTKLCVPKASIVHAVAGLPLGRKAQERSLRALEMGRVKEKSRGWMPGTPPTEHTAGSPLPRSCETWICKSGRRSGSDGFEFRTEVPGRCPESPGTASTTIRNPSPIGRS